MSPLRDGQFAREVARAAAQRGRLDPVYQDLSEHFRLMFQKLYPVWVLLGPGLGSPAHIELTSRTVMMDSDRLLGDRATILAGALLPFRILVTIGVGLHEVFHAEHTKAWVGERDLELAESEDPDDRQLAEDRRLLEEPRMEAHGVRDHAPATGRGRFVRKALRAAVADVLLAEFGELLAKHIAFGVPISRDLCGRSMTYLHARTHCGTVDPQILDAADRRSGSTFSAARTWPPSTTCTPGWCGSTTATTPRSTGSRGSTARSSGRLRRRPRAPAKAAGTRAARAGTSSPATPTDAGGDETRPAQPAARPGTRTARRSGR